MPSKKIRDFFITNNKEINELQVVYKNKNVIVNKKFFS
ncbi:hypothetical protein HMPREF1320_0622 [Capnocytophaga sp. oral taxon 335 str. F0486]|nr:hypothetical protein HMPREF1320_0622 [Capnocytophaga sp. oral taxon 335 str. F0486]